MPRSGRARRQSAGEWARAHGIDGRSLHAWKINIERGVAPAVRRRSAVTPVRPALVELVPEAPRPSTPSRYVLEVGDARVEFGDDVSTATLRRVVEALRSC